MSGCIPGGYASALFRVFFIREHRKSTRELFEKSAREHFATAREDFGINLPVNPFKVHANMN